MLMSGSPDYLLTFVGIANRYGYGSPGESRYMLLVGNKAHLARKEQRCIDIHATASLCPTCHFLDFSEQIRLFEYVKRDVSEMKMLKWITHYKLKTPLASERRSYDRIEIISLLTSPQNYFILDPPSRRKTKDEIRIDFSCIIRDICTTSESRVCVQLHI